jgi:uncharacterized membrane protein YjfL (UPF0719 family)
MDIFQEYLITLGWAVTGLISMAIAIPVLITVFNKFSPIDEWAEIKKGNVGVAIIIASLIIGFAIVIGMTVKG